MPTVYATHSVKLFGILFSFVTCRNFFSLALPWFRFFPEIGGIFQCFAKFSIYFKKFKIFPFKLGWFSQPHIARVRYIFNFVYNYFCLSWGDFHVHHLHLWKKSGDVPYQFLYTVSHLNTIKTIEI